MHLYSKNELSQREKEKGHIRTFRLKSNRPIQFIFVNLKKILHHMHIIVGDIEELRREKTRMVSKRLQNHAIF